MKKYVLNKYLSSELFTKRDHWLMRILTTFLFLSVINFSHGQLIAMPESAQNLVNYHFLGSDYSVSNIYYSGNGFAIGKFDATATNIGLNKGIVLTTGVLYNLSNSGPQGPNNMPNSGVDNGTQGSSLLTVLFSQQTMNAAELEFDFIPSIDSLELLFVYGSEEYPEYVGQPFIDPAGIFISGPGFSGIQNLAILPGSFSPINVNSLNNGSANVGPCQNCAYYTYNGEGSNAPYNASSSYIQFDGYTTVLKAKANNLQIGSPYHLRILIADAADAIYDSGIFIESCPTCDFNLETTENKGTNFAIYPNPVKDELIIKGLNMNKSVSKIQIIGINGQLIYDQKGYDEKIDVSHLNSGVYLLQIESQNGFETIRFVKE